MAEANPVAQTWIGRGIYVAIVLFLIFVHLLPLDTMTRTWAPPDMMLAVTFAWAARRPDYVPALLIASAFVLTDILFHRPPGLWAGIVLIGSEVLRHRSPDLRAVAFPLEWLTVSLVVVGAVMANRLALALAMAPQAPLPLVMFQMVATVMVYPVVTLLSYYIAGVDRPAPGAVDSLGHRI
ncbi:rod shape-determining protein MreD [Pelagovum pacificum]|uniref:Rod shape-determining protein MreD n=1 Tax=Pelagovum pacificum TaxID=2588711 RepID=A0A5C5G9L5_9RHOB|nr:rod shape-determining protein MreD [Pelagovum pacificum]QQA42351.1 rod shape-determining protein MreD [Pelagovum pacificum]TNY31435.1 rod shape-determining protein MreD [Pelagovum pacificum]